jgi:hypothetical protein
MPDMKLPVLNKPESEPLSPLGMPAIRPVTPVLKKPDISPLMAEPPVALLKRARHTAVKERAARGGVSKARDRAVAEKAVPGRRVSKARDFATCVSKARVGGAAVGREPMPVFTLPEFQKPVLKLPAFVWRGCRQTAARGC